LVFCAAHAHIPEPKEFEFNLSLRQSASFFVLMLYIARNEGEKKRRGGGAKSYLKKNAVI
jgi:hypothetical protein